MILVRVFTAALASLGGKELHRTAKCPSRSMAVEYCLVSTNEGHAHIMLTRIYDISSLCTREFVLERASGWLERHREDGSESGMASGTSTYPPRSKCVGGYAFTMAS